MMSSVICCVCFVPRAHRPARRDCAVVSRVPVPAHIVARLSGDSGRYSNGTVERGPVPRSA